MPVYVNRSRTLSKDGYIIGEETDKVGPFLTRTEAHEWLADHPEYSDSAPGVYHRVAVIDPFEDATHPEDYDG